MSEMFQRERFDLSDEIVIEVKDFSRAGKYQNINFKVRKGEIFGIAGLVGQGVPKLSRDYLVINLLKVVKSIFTEKKPRSTILLML
ncbi:Hypothetical Sugar ABC transporter, ATP-binding protein (fragment) [Avibacterium paragallinarum JF4211]